MEVGEKIRKLKLVKKIFQKVPYKTIKWLCKCDCGNEKIIADSSIRSGRTVSCGCAKSSRNEYYETKIYLEKMKTKLTRNTIINNNGCWIWNKSRHKQGYANVSYRGTLQLGHRVSYELFKGKIPENTKVCHKCDVTSCCNPNHLFLGSQQDNVDDAISKGKYHNRKQGKPVRRKFSFSQAQEIKKMNSEGMSVKELAKKYSCSISCIRNIVIGETYIKEFPQEI